MKVNDRGRQCERDWRYSLVSLTEKTDAEVDWLVLLSEENLGRQLRTINQASGIPDAPAFRRKDAQGTRRPALPIGDS